MWKNKFALSAFFALVSMQQIAAQADRWQQRIKYQINVNMLPEKNQLNGVEKIEYYNNAPDTLYKLYFHTYWNAFQPNSMMDVRSRELGKTVLGQNRKGENILDWDARVRDRISKLTPDEIGFQKIISVKVNGVAVTVKDYETIVQINLAKPILPKSKADIEVVFEAQVPLQVRRSGRNNAEGVQYGMSQWYPKMAEYDYQGWHANPYVAREFYGVWGDYAVNITIDKKYLLAGTGTIINKNQVGFGYEDAGTKTIPNMGKKLTWQFSAQNVHDFVWAADTAYNLIKKQVPNGPLLYVVNKKADEISTAKWQKLADTAALAYSYIAKNFGAYPYKNYSFIQGGDGGMEYPMATLIKNASIGTAIHEWMHTWFQMLLGTNESLYPWMDEGFTSYAESRTMGKLRGEDSTNWLVDDYAGYYSLAKSGYEEPMSTHADHYNTNFAYGRAAYAKGAVFIAQLGYIVGQKALDKIMLDYYNTWRFKHPNPNDFIRIAEKVSGLELDWYKEYMVNTTKTIDYAVGDITQTEEKAHVVLKRVGQFPMPIDILIIYKDGTKELHYVPLNIMYGEKQPETNLATFVHEPWKWTHPTYDLALPKGVSLIKEIVIDPSKRLADINDKNNDLVIPNY